MKKSFFGVFLGFFAVFSVFIYQQSFDDKYQVKKIFEGGRFPGIAVSQKGTVLAFWGDQKLLVKSSNDGGLTFGPQMVISDKAINGGGVITNELTGEIFAFSQSEHPPSKKYIHSSVDDGITWETRELDLKDKKNGNKTQLHFAGSGIQIKSGNCKGLMIRPTRVYGKETGLNNSIASYDGVKWSQLGAISVKGVGEGAIVELEEDLILYSSRRHWFPDQLAASSNRLMSLSDNCGLSWKENFEADGLPDGPRYRDLSKGKGASHQGHFGIMGDMGKLYCDGRRVLLHTSVNDPDSDWNRKGLTLWTSFDGGITWPLSELIYDGPSAYSALAVIEDKENCENSKILIHFEGGVNKEYQGSYLAVLKFGSLIPQSVELEIRD